MSTKATLLAHLLDIDAHTTADGVAVHAGDVVWEADGYCAFVKRRVIREHRQCRVPGIPFKPYGWAEPERVFSTRIAAEHRVLARMELELVKTRRHVRSLAQSIAAFKEKMLPSPLPLSEQEGR